MDLEKLNSTKITEREYRSHPSLSRSELWKLNDSPEKFKWAKDNPPEQTEAFLFGSVVHKLVLEPDDFFNEYSLAPDIDRRTKAGKEEFERFLSESADKTIITNKFLSPALHMVDVVMNNKLAQLLLDGPHEIPFFWTDEQSGIDLKCRVDGLTEIDDRIVIVDYKSAANAKTDVFCTEAIRYGYHFQAAFYAEGVRQSLGLDYTPQFVFIAQEKKPPYSINVIMASEGMMLLGYDKMREILGIYQECDAFGDWYGYNGYNNEMNEAILPGWVQLGVDEEGED